MSDDNDIGLSEDLEQFILLAVGTGLNNLREEGSLVPMVLSARGDEITLGALAVEADELMGLAAQVVSELPPETDFYALLFDGKMDVDGDILSAVIVQAGERGAGPGHMIYQKYDPETLEAIGPPEHAGRVERNFAGESPI